MNANLYSQFITLVSPHRNLFTLYYNIMNYGTNSYSLIQNRQADSHIAEYCNYVKPVKKTKNIVIEYRDRRNLIHQVPTTQHLNTPLSKLKPKETSLKPITAQLKTMVSDYKEEAMFVYKSKAPKDKKESRLGMSPYARMLLIRNTESNIKTSMVRNNVFNVIYDDSNKQIKVSEVDRDLHCFRYNPSFRREGNLKLLNRLNSYKDTDEPLSKHIHSFKLYKEPTTELMSAKVKEKIKGYVDEVKESNDINNKKIKHKDNQKETTIDIEINEKPKQQDEDTKLVPTIKQTIDINKEPDNDYSNIQEISCRNTHCGIEAQTLIQKDIGIQYEIQRQIPEEYIRKDSTSNVDLSQSLDNISSFIKPIIN